MGIVRVRYTIQKECAAIQINCSWLCIQLVPHWLFMRVVNF